MIILGIGAPRNLSREGLNVKFEHSEGKISKKIVLSPKKSNCEVSLRKW